MLHQIDPNLGVSDEGTLLAKIEGTQSASINETFRYRGEDANRWLKECQMKAEDNSHYQWFADEMERGVTREEAERTARREFSNAASLVERTINFLIDKRWQSPYNLIELLIS
jgi:hypothetical protein